MGCPRLLALEWVSPWNGLGRAGAAASNTEYCSLGMGKGPKRTLELVNYMLE